MTWIRVDDHFAGHLKVMALEKDRLAGLGLWHVAASYCARYLTDGYVPMTELKGQAPPKLVAKMVRVGLFEQRNGGFLLHDWLNYNPSRQQVIEEKGKKRAAGRAGGQAAAQARGTASAVAEPVAPAQAKSKPVPVPVPEVLKEVLGGRAKVEDFVEPMELYLKRSRHKSASQKERDWIEDLHARFSRGELVTALQIVEPGRDYLKRVDGYLEGGGLDRLG